MTEIDRRTLLRNAAAGSVLVAFGGVKALDRSSPIEPSVVHQPVHPRRRFGRPAA